MVKGLGDRISVRSLPDPSHPTDPEQRIGQEHFICFLQLVEPDGSAPDGHLSGQFIDPPRLHHAVHGPLFGVGRVQGTSFDQKQIGQATVRHSTRTIEHQGIVPFLLFGKLGCLGIKEGAGGLATG